MADTDTKPLSMAPQASLFVIGHLRWDIYGDRAMTEVRRKAAALDRLSKLLKTLNDGPGPDFPRYYMLEGQMSFIEEVADIRPDLQALILIFNAGGKLALGPWYTQIEETLVNSESLVRNLLLARVMAQRHGVKLANYAFMPSIRTHVRQLPQIMRGFGITTTVLHQNSTAVTAPFRWLSPDGSNVLVLTHAAGGISDAADIVAGVEFQKALRPDGPFLWLLEFNDEMPMLSSLETLLNDHLDVPVTAGDPADYLRALRYFLSDEQHPAFGGDLDPHSASSPPLSLSTRAYLKQANSHASYRLTVNVEPLLTVALSHGTIAQPENTRALLNHAWRNLLRGQQTTAISGRDTDDAHTRQEITFNEVEAISDHLAEAALDALPGSRLRAGNDLGTLQNSTYIVVWNGHNWPVKQIVELDIALPEGRHPTRLRIPDTEEELQFSWQPHADHTVHGGKLAFLAAVPGVGYATYILDLDDTPPGPHARIRTENGATIGSITGETLSVEGGVLNWKHMTAAGARTINDLLRFVDGGDAGDTFHFSPPDTDLVVTASMGDTIKVESSPLYERLVMQHRLRIAPGLNAQRGRERGLRRLDLHTTATFYHHMPGLYFHTSYENNAQDHRLRAHLRTGISARTLLTRGAYGFSKHLTGRMVPMDTVAAVTGRDTTLALLARGLPEVEAIHEDGATTLALTLLRSVGWLSRADLTARPGAIGAQIPVQGAQCLRPMTADFALRPVSRGDNPVLLRAAAEYAAPLHAYQYTTRPERPRRSYLSVVSDMADGSSSDGEGAIVTAFKPPQKGQGWIVRLFNPHEHVVEVLLTPHAHPEFVQRVTLAEEPIHHIDTDANGRVSVTIKPQQIVTLRIRFA